MFQPLPLSEVLKPSRRGVSLRLYVRPDVVLFKFVPPVNIARGLLTARVLGWHLLPCTITFYDLLDRLPGYLRWNSLEIQPLLATKSVYTQFVNRHVSPGTPDWSEGKLLCGVCVLKLMGRRVLNSLRELKAQRTSSGPSSPDMSGDNRTSCPDGPQLEDCWYGYKCRTQRKDSHAVKLNVRARGH